MLVGNLMTKQTNDNENENENEENVSLKVNE